MPESPSGGAWTLDIRIIRGASAGGDALTLLLSTSCSTTDSPSLIEDTSYRVRGDLGREWIRSDLSGSDLTAQVPAEGPWGAHGQTYGATVRVQAQHHHLGDRPVTATFTIDDVLFALDGAPSENTPAYVAIGVQIQRWNRATGEFAGGVGGDLIFLASGSTSRQAVYAGAGEGKITFTAESQYEYGGLFYADARAIYNDHPSFAWVEFDAKQIAWCYAEEAHGVAS